MVAMPPANATRKPAPAEISTAFTVIRKPRGHIPPVRHPFGLGEAEVLRQVRDGTRRASPTSTPRAASTLFFGRARRATP